MKGWHGPCSAHNPRDAPATRCAAGRLSLVCWECANRWHPLHKDTRSDMSVNDPMGVGGPPTHTQTDVIPEKGTSGISHVDIPLATIV